MPKGHRHLTYDQRCQIGTLLERGDNQSTIAKTIKVNRSSISKEIQRNGGKSGYCYEKAHKIATSRRKAASMRPHKMTGSLLEKVEEKLINDQWSPDQISGWLARDGISISHETLYQHIWADKKKDGMLWKHLRHRGKKYNKRANKTAGRGLIPNRTDIEKRPEIVETKSRLGDWEGDTIIGKNHKGAIMSHVDRKSKYTKLSLLPDKRAKSVENACKKALSSFSDTFETITYDNGKEFAGHEKIAKLLDCDIYFAKPYHSWQRGLNEHTNGLVRQYFPKGTDFTKLTPKQVQEVEDKINQRPRKILNYKTPYEVFSKLREQNVAFHC